MKPPTSRNEFEIAIICAIAREYTAVGLALDEPWKQDLGRAVGDENQYKLGRIGNFNVVVVRLPNMGKGTAAGITASLRSSFPEVRMALVTGICGGVPGAKETPHESMMLGDVIVGTTIVQYDLGWRNINGFAMKDDVESVLGRGARVVRNLAHKLDSDDKYEIEEQAGVYLLEIQKAISKNIREKARYNYPGAAVDKLFRSNYHHKHHQGCETCNKGPDKVCGDASLQSCSELKCDDKYLVPRDRLEEKKTAPVNEAQNPFIFFGRIGSGDSVIRSGVERDRIAALHKLLAFEMEGAGVFNEIPCIVIKGVCDYADSHKQKNWQNFAAATAACVAKALIGVYPQTDKTSGNDSAGPAQTAQAIFNGPVTGHNVVSGINHSGGTSNYTFNN